MTCSNEDCRFKSYKLCPVSFGLAVGIVCFFCLLLWSCWVMIFGMSPTMMAWHIPFPTVGMAFAYAIFGFIKGFIFGFFVALFYDLISCCKCFKRHSEDVTVKKDVEVNKF